MMAYRSKPSPATTRRKILSWRDDPANESTSAQIGRHLLAGGVVDTDWLMEVFGQDGLTLRQMVTVVCGEFRRAGWEVIVEAPPEGHAKGAHSTYRLASTTPAPLPPEPVRIQPGTRRQPPKPPEPDSVAVRARMLRQRAEPQGGEHPELGARLEVRALALDAEGQVMMQLSDGNGRAWQATIVGFVSR